MVADPAAAETLWPCHLPALEAFLVIAGQWRVVAGFGGAAWLGLDYAAARAGLDLAGIATTPALWAEVREIEQGALEALNRT